MSLFDYSLPGDTNDCSVLNLNQFIKVSNLQTNEFACALRSASIYTIDVFGSVIKKFSSVKNRKFAKTPKNEYKMSNFLI